VSARNARRVLQSIPVLIGAYLAIEEESHAKPQSRKAAKPQSRKEY
jgi:hypothetical protein